MPRPKGSKNKPKPLTDKQVKDLYNAKEHKRLQDLIDHQDQAVAQAQDQISDLQGQVEFYRKQVNHFLALLNIVIRGQ